MDPTVFVNFGAGVQSSCLAMLAINKHPDFVRAIGGRLPETFIFADTGDETKETYEHLKGMRVRLEAAGFKLEIVSKGETLSDHVLKGEKSNVSIPPFFVQDRHGGSVPVNRGCTLVFKVIPIKAFISKTFGRRLRVPVTQIFGISADEAQRMREPDKQNLTFLYPLVNMGWKRSHCAEYLASFGIVAPRSACRFCPFHTVDEWKRLRRMPDEWRAIVEFEEAVGALYDRQGLAGLRTKPFLHESRQAIESIDWDAQQDLFSLLDDCEGLCGV